MAITASILNFDEYSLAYKQIGGKSPTILFCAGFNSTMEGNKALSIEVECLKRGQGFIRFDYRGHGESDGDFAHGTVSQWLEDTLAVIDELIVGPVIIVGSSMGGWIALLSALARPERVCGLLLIACAADMTKYYSARLAGVQPLTDESGCQYYPVSNSFDDCQPYFIYQRLLEDGKQYTLLGAPIKLSIPVSFIHGMQDDVVPWQRTQDVADALRSKLINVKYIENGDHRLSKASDLAVILASLNKMLNEL